MERPSTDNSNETGEAALSNHIFKCSLFKLKYTVQFIYYCLNGVFNRPLYVRGSHLCCCWNASMVLLLQRHRIYPNSFWINGCDWSLYLVQDRNSVWEGSQSLSAEQILYELARFIWFPGYLAPKLGSCWSFPIHDVPDKCLVDPVAVSLFLTYCSGSVAFCNGAYIWSNPHVWTLC